MIWVSSVGKFRKFWIGQCEKNDSSDRLWLYQINLCWNCIIQLAWDVTGVKKFQLCKWLQTSSWCSIVDSFTTNLDGPDSLLLRFLPQTCWCTGRLMTGEMPGSQILFWILSNMAIVALQHFESNRNLSLQPK